MIIAAVTHQRSLAGPLLGNAVFLWIGTRSYGLYLFHWPIYQMMRRVAGRPLSVPQFLIGTAVACVVTELSYRFDRDAGPQGPRRPLVAQPQGGE